MKPETCFTDEISSNIILYAARRITAPGPTTDLVVDRFRDDASIAKRDLPLAWALAFTGPGGRLPTFLTAAGRLLGAEVVAAGAH